MVASSRFMPYTLLADGDGFERHYHPLFLNAEFPAYEEFWVRFVVPLTNRPADIQFKSDADLLAIGHGSQDICIAQLHYSVLRNLVRAFDIRGAASVTVDLLCAGMSALVGAQDTAFDLLERFRHPAQYDPWLDKRRVKGGSIGSQEAQREWKEYDKYPLQDIRDYRNCLMHGRTMPGIGIAGSICVPVIGRELHYLDWRNVTGVAPGILPLHDFAEPIAILADAWYRTVAYLQSKWATELLPNV
jgi:hypothetical protein